MSSSGIVPRQAPVTAPGICDPAEEQESPRKEGVQPAAPEPQHAMSCSLTHAGSCSPFSPGQETLHHAEGTRLSLCGASSGQRKVPRTALPVGSFRQG